MTRTRKLTDDQVREISLTYQYRKHGCGYCALAKKYGAGDSMICDVPAGRTAYERQSPFVRADQHELNSWITLL